MTAASGPETVMKGNQFSRNLYISSFPSSAGRSMHRSRYVNRPKQAGRKSMRVDDGLKTDMVRILGCVKTNAERFRNPCERAAWPNNSLYQAPGGRSATARRSLAQGRVWANARQPDVQSPSRRREWTSWRTYHDWSGRAPKGAKGPGSAARFAYLQHRHHETQSRPADL